MALKPKKPSPTAGPKNGPRPVHLFIYSFIHLFIHLFAYSSIYLFNEAYFTRRRPGVRQSGLLLFLLRVFPREREREREGQSEWSGRKVAWRLAAAAAAAAGQGGWIDGSIEM